MSGYTQEEVVRAGRELGAAFLRKPFTREELLDAVQARIRGPDRSSETSSP
jgi:DNA-binding response OmpR family regulator